MALVDDIRNRVRTIFKETWTTRNGQVVPEDKDVKLSNDAVKLTGTVLYADLTASTHLVDTFLPEFAAEIYKSYLYCAGRIVNFKDGTITAYDGDRVMAVFLGDHKNTNAVRAAFMINYAVTYIINPMIKECYSTASYQVQQTVGIDTSDVLVARTGVRGANDLVWVGRAANYAAKLSALAELQPTRITAAVFSKLGSSEKVFSGGGNIWSSSPWREMNGTVYSTSAYVEF